MSTKVLLVISAIALLIFIAMYQPNDDYQRHTDLVKEYNFENEPLIITVEFLPQARIAKEFERLHGNKLDTQTLSGFAVLSPTDFSCHVRTREVRSQEDTKTMELLGHEILHCIYGRWHPGNEDLVSEPKD